jgi:DNA replication protein DnaC
MERDPESQPDWREDVREREETMRATVERGGEFTLLGTRAGLVRRGHFVYLRVARQWGGGSLIEIFPECPRCGMTWPAAWINPFFTKIVGQTVYGQFKTCEACLTAVDAQAKSQQLENRLRVLETLGFTTVQRQWTFDTYPNQGSPWLRRARQFVAAPLHDVLIYGNPGVGKTGLAIAILRSLWNQGRRVRSIRASELIMALRGTDAESTQRLFGLLADVDFLLVDDLSAIRRTEFWEEMLNVLIDLRQQASRVTLMTANIRIGRDDPSSVLTEFFGYVAYDRLVERGEFWHMKGNSTRQAYNREKPATGQSAYEQRQREP